MDMTIGQAAPSSDAPIISPPCDQAHQTFKRSIPKVVLTLLICCLFVVGGAFMFQYPRPGRTDALMGIFAMIFFGSGILRSLAQLFDRRPIAVVTTGALSCPDKFEGQIAWRHIQKCELVVGKRSRHLTLTVDASALNALTWRSPSRWIRRATTAASQLIIPLGMVSNGADRLEALCLKYAENAKSERLQNPELAALDQQNDLAEAKKIDNAERISASLSFPFVTIGLIALLVALFAAEILLPATPETSHLTPSLQTLAKFGGLYSDGVKRGEWYRLFSAALLHGNFLHVLMNCIALLIVGLRFERFIGSAWFAAIFAVSAIFGSLMSIGVNPPTLISIGASGGIVGLFAATAIGSFHFRNGSIRIRLLITAFQTLIPSLLPLATAKSGMRIDYADHFGGAVGGAIMGFLLLRAWQEDQAKPVLAKPALIIATTFFLIGLYPISRLNFVALPENIRHATAPVEKGAASESDISRTASGLAGDVASVCHMSDDQALEAARAVLPRSGSQSALHDAWKSANDGLFKQSQQKCNELYALIKQSPPAQPATTATSPEPEPTFSKMLYGDVIEQSPEFYCAVSAKYYKIDNRFCSGPPVSGQPCRCLGTAPQAP